jgi:hypothetical protein
MRNIFILACQHVKQGWKMRVANASLAGDRLDGRKINKSERVSVAGVQ